MPNKIPAPKKRLSLDGCSAIVSLYKNAKIDKETNEPYHENVFTSWHVAGLVDGEFLGRWQVLRIVRKAAARLAKGKK